MGLQEFEMTQGFDDAWKENRHVWESTKNLSKAMCLACAASRQAEIDAALKQRDSFIKAHHIAMNDVCDLRAEIDELQKRIDVYEKHIAVIKHIHENEFNENSDTSWILGNLDGFFECLNEDLKGNQDD